MKSRSDAPLRFTAGAAAVLALLVGGGLASLAMVVWAAWRTGQ